MKILITGGAGFIGSHLVDAYCERGDIVHVIDNISTGNIKNLHPLAVLHQADITDSKMMHQIFAEVKPELVIHAAAQASIPRSIEDPLNDERVNVDGTVAILKAASAAGGVKRFVNLSTAGVLYGDSAIRPTPETAVPQLTNPYVSHKIQAEAAVERISKESSFLAVTLRLSNIYGPRQNPKTEAGVVSIFIEALLDDRVPVINGDGLQTRDFVYVADLVAAVMQIAETEHTGVFHVSSSTETTVRTALEMVAQALQVADVVPEHAPAKKDEQRYSCISYDKLKSAVGWEPQVSFAEGVLETAAWFERKRKKNRA